MSFLILRYVQDNNKIYEELLTLVKKFVVKIWQRYDHDNIPNLLTETIAYLEV